MKKHGSAEPFSQAPSLVQNVTPTVPCKSYNDLKKFSKQQFKKIATPFGFNKLPPKASLNLTAINTGISTSGENEKQQPYFVPNDKYLLDKAQEEELARYTPPEVLSLDSWFSRS